MEDITDSDDEDYPKEITFNELLDRRNKIKKLMKLYKSQFRKLRDVLRNKHRRFIRLKQRGEEEKLFIAESTKSKIKKKQKQLLHHYHVKHSKSVKDAKMEKKNKKKALLEEYKQRSCNYSGCKGFCMPLTDYCYAHILCDTKQKLFGSCQYTNRTTGGICNYPILANQTPPFCNVHVEDADGKEAKGRKRKSGLNDEIKENETKKIASNLPRQMHTGLERFSNDGTNLVFGSSLKLTSFQPILPRQNSGSLQLSRGFPQVDFNRNKDITAKVGVDGPLPDQLSKVGPTNRPIGSFPLSPFFSYSVPTSFGTQSGVPSINPLHHPHLQVKLQQTRIPTNLPETTEKK